MYPRVTAIVVAQSGGPHLQRTLDALAAQTRRPDAVIAVDCASTDDAARLLAESRPTQFLSLPEKLPFGAAVAAAVRVLPPTSGPEQLLWLLAQDTAPEPQALEALLAALEVSPSVAVVGPKLVDWDDPAFIREFGEAMTPFGASVPLVENELDQAQHDGLSDVLAVSSAGMLVRQALWERLDGFDPALPAIDDGLDFCTRARLAGFRVMLVAQARVAIAGDGLAGPNLSRKWTVRRRLAGSAAARSCTDAWRTRPAGRCRCSGSRSCRSASCAGWSGCCARSRARSAESSARRSASRSPGWRSATPGAGCPPRGRWAGPPSRPCASRSPRCVAPVR
ncbi:glycosyltransferase family 2 protein [Leifsonia xyli]|uniref:glycosyltransferase family 2 protein n=1 Tax=Leifsonia xyli TaxID=1575 RepID=UPI003D6681F8